jgi:hypothetical protein
VDETCIVWAPLISWVVDFLKRVPFLAKSPKAVALVATLGVALLQVRPSPEHAFPLSQVLVCVLTTWAGTIATYELVTKPVIQPVALALGLRQSKGGSKA